MVGYLFSFPTRVSFDYEIFIARGPKSFFPNIINNNKNSFLALFDLTATAEGKNGNKSLAAKEIRVAYCGSWEKGENFILKQGRDFYSSTADFLRDIVSKYL